MRNLDEDMSAVELNNIGVALINSGDIKKAIDYFDKSLQINPNDANTWNNKGLAFYGLRNYLEALKCFAKSLEINPNDATVCNNTGIALCELNNYELAAKCFAKSLEINPNDATVWNYIGNTLLNFANAVALSKPKPQGAAYPPKQGLVSKQVELFLSDPDNYEFSLGSG